MQYAEVIYETGAHSVMSFDDESELKSALTEQHRRAISGEDGGPTGHRAERIKRVIVYSGHPADAPNNSAVSGASLKELIDGIADKDGNVDVHRLNQLARDELSPVYPTNQGRHESVFKSDGTELVISGWFNGGIN